MGTKLSLRRRGSFFALAVLLAACTSTPSSVDSGVEGHVWVGPTCPVVVAGTECPDEPYETELDIVAADGDVVATVESDEQGRYRITLSPGDYVLQPRLPMAGIPWAEPIPFTVQRGEWTVVDVHYDSGIR